MKKQQNKKQNKQKKKQLYGPDWPKFWILGEILLESLKISHFFQKISQNIFTYRCRALGGGYYFTCAQNWERDDYIQAIPKYYKFSPKFPADPFEDVISFCMFKWV